MTHRFPHRSDRHPGPRVVHWPAGAPVPMIRDDVALAVYWCALSNLRPQDDRAFYEAERRGLLTHKGVWDITRAGLDYLARAIHRAGYAYVAS